MKTKQLVILFFKKYLFRRNIFPLLSLIGMCVLLVAVGSIVTIPQNKNFEEETKDIPQMLMTITPQQKIITEIATPTTIATQSPQPTMQKTVSPEPKITVSPEEKIETPAPALTISLSQSPTPATASPAITISPTPKATPTPTITPKPTSNASNAVTIHIVQPNITQEFSVASGDHTDACAILLQAKNENPGKITSLDIVTYPQNNSKYLRELNGFADNWKYTVNGTSPDKDCSQMIVKPNDIIQWKFTSS